MSKELEKPLRSKILEFESMISKTEGAQFGNFLPLKHTFATGIYVREIFIPAGMVLTGKIHRHDHPNFLMSGEVTVVTEDGGLEVLRGPLSMISPAGTKRALYAHTDLVWITVHLNPTNTRDIDKLEEKIVVETYEQLSWTPTKRLLNKIKKVIGVK